MTQRPNPYIIAPELMKPLIDFGQTVAKSGLEASLLELVKVRASQINGCSVCLHMHTRTALQMGETEERLVMLDAWRESPLYTDRERAGMAWTEALTKLTETKAPDDVYALVEAQFTPEEQVKLTLMITAINSFNRIGVGFRVGHQPARKQAA